MSCNHNHARADNKSGSLSGTFLIAGVIAPRFGADELTTHILLWISCAVGGWHVTFRSFAQLFRFELDVDLLMLVAAIGAGVINRW